MSGQSAPQQTPNDPPVETALDRLSAHLSADMKKVNELILHRMKSDVPMIPKLAGYLIAAKGKRIRPLLTIAGARLYGDESPRPWPLAAAVEFIHTASLLHDDVVDDSDERRGSPSANVVFGNEASVLVGDFLFSRAFQLMVEDGSLDVLRTLSHASAVIAEGEVMQLATARNLKTTFAEYEAVIRAKTAALFMAACEIGPIIGGQDTAAQNAMREFGANLGMAFQIIDDVLDYTADPQALGKEIGHDFRDGKMTAPVVFALQTASEGERAFWQRTMEDGIQTPADLGTAQDFLKAHDVFKHCHAAARDYARKAQDMLKNNTPAGPMQDMLSDIVDFAVTRGR